MQPDYIKVLRRREKIRALKETLINIAFAALALLGFWVTDVLLYALFG